MKNIKNKGYHFRGSRSWVQLEYFWVLDPRSYFRNWGSCVSGPTLIFWGLVSQVLDLTYGSWVPVPTFLVCQWVWMDKLKLPYPPSPNIGQPLYKNNDSSMVHSWYLSLSSSVFIAVTRQYFCFFAFCFSGDVITN